MVGSARSMRRGTALGTTPSLCFKTPVTITCASSVAPASVPGGASNVIRTKETGKAGERLGMSTLKEVSTPNVAFGVRSTTIPAMIVTSAVLRTERFIVFLLFDKMFFSSGVRCHSLATRLNNWSGNGQRESRRPLRTFPERDDHIDRTGPDNFWYVTGNSHHEGRRVTSRCFRGGPLRTEQHHIVRGGGGETCSVNSDQFTQNSRVVRSGINARDSRT